MPTITPNFNIGDVVRRTGVPWRNINTGDTYIIAQQRQSALSGDIEIMLHISATEWYAADEFALVSRVDTPFTVGGQVWTTPTFTTEVPDPRAAQSIPSPPDIESVEAPAEFQVGDMVKLVRNSAQGPESVRGTIQQVVRVQRDNDGPVKYYFGRGSSATWYQYAQDLQLVKAVKPKQDPTRLKNFSTFLKSKAVVS